MIETLASLGATARFTGRAAALVPRSLREPRLALDELWTLGVSSLPVVAVTAMFAGTVLAVQGYQTFRQFGAQNMVGLFVSMAGVGELAPVLAAAMVAALAGAGITSDLAAMKNSQQLDAMETMGVDPVERLVAPKLVALALGLPALTMIGAFLMVASAGVVAVWQLGVEHAWFLANVTDWIGPPDLYKGVLKAEVFAIVIWTVSCRYGFTAGPGPEGVGTATNRAIVVEVLLCLMLNVILTALLYPPT